MDTTRRECRRGLGNSDHRPLVGAYYYLWNPENLVQWDAAGSPGALPGPAGLCGRFARNPQTTPPTSRHARRAGIDFFAVDWWPSDAGYSGRDYRSADAAMGDFRRDLRRFKFAMFYETWNLGFDPRRRPHR